MTLLLSWAPKSAFAAKTLAGLGYENVHSLAGGFTDWKRNGLEITMPRTLSPERRTRYSRHILIPEIGEEGQRKLLASQSDLATLTVSVSEAGDPVVKATTKPRSGISQAFENAKDGFVTGVESIISHSGRALLWLLCIAVIAMLLRSGWRVARRRLV